MRWNCPHCSTLVNLDIDLDQNPKAYVRCGKCMGIALIQKKAFADTESLPAERDLAKGFMSARDALQEEQTNLQNSQRAIANHYLKTHPEGEEENSEAFVEAPSIELNAGGPIREFRAKTSLPRPPAFLLSAAVTTSQSSAPSTLYSTFHVDTEADQSAARIRSIIILVIAAAALFGGIYLFIQGQKAMTASHLKSRISADAIQLESASSISNSQVVASNPPPMVVPTNNDAPSGTKAARIRVIVPQAILRSGPSVDSTAVDRIGQNEIMTIQSFRGNWIQVEGRKNGWLRNDLVTMTQ